MEKLIWRTKDPVTGTTYEVRMDGDEASGKIHWCNPCQSFHWSKDRHYFLGAVLRGE
ncbi:MAG: hypothetical protein ACYCOU_23415 [Sulfobacillus sp.]